MLAQRAGLERVHVLDADSAVRARDEVGSDLVHGLAAAATPQSIAAPELAPQPARARALRPARVGVARADRAHEALARRLGQLAALGAAQVGQAERRAALRGAAARRQPGGVAPGGVAGEHVVAGRGQARAAAGEQAGGRDAVAAPQRREPGRELARRRGGARAARGRGRCASAASQRRGGGRGRLDVRGREVDAQPIADHAARRRRPGPRSPRVERRARQPGDAQRQRAARRARRRDEQPAVAGRRT